MTLIKFPKELLPPISIALFSLIFSLLVLPAISLNLFQNPRLIEYGTYEAWNIWDAPHYLDIADNWYVSTGEDANWIVFLPLYPILVAAAEYIPFLGILHAGYLVSAVTSIGSAMVFYKLLRLDESQKTSFMSVTALFLFPTSFFLFLPYPESTFLLLILLSFYNLRKGNFLIGSVFAMLATSSKIAGLALVPVIFVEFVLHHIRFQKPAKLLKAFLTLNLPIAGFLFYLLINYQIFGDIFYFQKAQGQNWNTGFYPVIPGFKQAVSFTSDYEFETRMYLGFGQIASFILAFVTVVYSWFSLRKTYFYYSLAFFVIYSSMSFWLSFPRYLLSLFPLFIMLGRFSANWIFMALWVFFSLILLFVFGIIALEHGPVL